MMMLSDPLLQEQSEKLDKWTHDNNMFPQYVRMTQCHNCIYGISFTFMLFYTDPDGGVAVVYTTKV